MSATTGNAIKADVNKAAKKVVLSPVMETFTRLGYGVRGLIYLLMGIFAVEVAFGKSGTLANQQGVIAAIGRQPAGKIFLWVILIGLISYALWGVVRAVFDPLHKGHDLKGLMSRFGFLVSAFGYAVLVPPTYGYIMGLSKSTQGTQNQKFIASIMAMPWGRYAVGIFGLGMLVGGIYQIYFGLKAGFDRQFLIYALKPKDIKLFTALGRFGTAARGVVFAIVGFLICRAAYYANPSQPIGTDSALATLLRQPYGIYLLGIIAVGLIAFGLYSMLCGVWLRLKR